MQLDMYKTQEAYISFLTLIVHSDIFLIIACMSDAFCFTELFKGYTVIQEMPTLKFICKSLTL